MRRRVKAVIVVFALSLFVVAFFYAPLVPTGFFRCLPGVRGYGSLSYYFFSHGEVYWDNGGQHQWFWDNEGFIDC